MGLTCSRWIADLYKGKITEKMLLVVASAVQPNNSKHCMLQRK